MKTKEEITVIIAGKLYQTHYNALTFNDLKASVVALSSANQAKLTEDILLGNDAAVGALLKGEMSAKAAASAQAAADALMVDDSLTLAELQQIF